MISAKLCKMKNIFKDSQLIDMLMKKINRILVNEENDWFDWEDPIHIPATRVKMRLKANAQVNEHTILDEETSNKFSYVIHNLKNWIIKMESQQNPGLLNNSYVSNPVLNDLVKSEDEFKDKVIEISNVKHNIAVSIMNLKNHWKVICENKHLLNDNLNVE